jgi:hypothetical protein
MAEPQSTAADRAAVVAADYLSSQLNREVALLKRLKTALLVLQETEQENDPPAHLTALCKSLASPALLRHKSEVRAACLSAALSLCHCHRDDRCATVRARWPAPPRLNARDAVWVDVGLLREGSCRCACVRSASLRRRSSRMCHAASLTCCGCSCPTRRSRLRSKRCVQCP